MYFWRIDNLKERLAAGPLTDREVLPYLATYGALTSLVVTIPPENPNAWDIAIGLVTALMTVLGTIWIYRMNGGQIGTHLAQRYLAVGWVTLVRLMAVVGPVLLVFYAAVAAFRPVPATDWYDVLVMIGIQVGYYQRLGSHIRQVVLRLPNKPLQPTSGGKTEVE